MTARPIEPRHSRPRAVFCHAVLSRLASGALIAFGICSCAFFVACTATNGELFDETLPLTPVARGGAAGVGSAPSAVVPSEMPPSSQPDPGNAGSGGTAGTPRPPRPPARPDAGVAAAEGDAGGAPPIPAVGDGSCGEQCARSGGLCSAGTCFFDCQATGSCANRQVICPSGVPCDVTCGDGACTQNVLCNRGSTCNIRCVGERSCAAELICEGQCDITCSGENSCAGGTGGAVQVLDLKCTGRESCGSTVQCEGQDCRVECSGRESCERVNIFGAQNTLVCSGARSCDTDVSCNGTRCIALCADNACDNNVSCQAVSCQVGELEDD